MKKQNHLFIQVFDHGETPETSKNCIGRSTIEELHTFWLILGFFWNKTLCITYANSEMLYLHSVDGALVKTMGEKY